MTGPVMNERKQLEHRLKERVKELQCLYSIARLVENPHISLNEVYSGVLSLTCAALQYPENACGKITINGENFETPNYRKTRWCLSSDIVVEGGEVGDITVCYLEEKLKVEGSPFLEEEKPLIDAVAERLVRITEHVKAEQALENSERLYRLLFQEAGEGIFLHDLMGNMTMANQALVELSGYSLAELMNMNISKWLSEPGFETITNIQKSQLENKDAGIGQRYQLQMIKKGGEKRTVEVSTRLLMDENQPPVSQSILRDITREKRIQENLRAYTNKVIEAQEEERKRIARDLHDETAQALLSLGMEIDSLIRTKEGQLPQDVVNYLEELRGRTNDIFQGVRYMSQALRPPVLEELGLSEAIRWLARDTDDQYGINIHCDIQGTPRGLTPEIELTLFRIAQEALTNIGKHALATKSIVQLDFNSEKVRLTISDNGRGFELPEGTDNLALSDKMGLIGMQERAWLIDGTLTLSSVLGEGTTVTLEIPH